MRHKRWWFDILNDNIFPGFHFLLISFHSGSNAGAVKHPLINYEFLKRPNDWFIVFIGVHFCHKVVFIVVGFESYLVLGIRLSAWNEVFNVFVFQIILSRLELENVRWLNAFLTLIESGFFKDSLSLIENFFSIVQDVYSQVASKAVDNWRIFRFILNFNVIFGWIVPFRLVAFWSNIIAQLRIVIGTGCLFQMLLFGFWQTYFQFSFRNMFVLFWNRLTFRLNLLWWAVKITDFNCLLVGLCFKSVEILSLWTKNVISHFHLQTLFLQLENLHQILWAHWNVEGFWKDGFKGFVN